METIKGAVFWWEWAGSFWGSWWLLIVVYVLLLIGVGKKAFSFRTMDQSPWKKAFWWILGVGLMILLYGGYDSYQTLKHRPQPTFQY